MSGLIQSITVNLPPNRFQKVKQALDLIYDALIEMDIELTDKDEEIKELQREAAHLQQQIKDD
jgi:hypothetical protein